MSSGAQGVAKRGGADSGDGPRLRNGKMQVKFTK